MKRLLSSESPDSKPHGIAETDGYGLAVGFSGFSRYAFEGVDGGFAKTAALRVFPEYGNLAYIPLAVHKEFKVHDPFDAGSECNRWVNGIPAYLVFREHRKHRDPVHREVVNGFPLLIGLPVGNGTDDNLLRNLVGFNHGLGYCFYGVCYDCRWLLLGRWGGEGSRGFFLHVHKPHHVGKRFFVLRRFLHGESHKVKQNPVQCRCGKEKKKAQLLFPESRGFMNP
jgi:hypothetical protein